METLEALLKAEKTLLDENEPFNFGDFSICTCGHILHAVEGGWRYAGDAMVDEHLEYERIIEEVARALGYDGVGSPIHYVSNHTLEQTSCEVTVQRKHALKTVRDAMMGLQPGSVPIHVEPLKLPAPVPMPEPVKEPVKV